MDYDGFITYCFVQGINPDIIRACRTKVMEDDYVLNHKVITISPTSSLGYAELSDITTVEQGIREIKESIWMSVCDFDERGRSLEKLRTKQLIKKPHRSLTRRVLKTYYLLNGKAD
jgi:hypothetical protein